MEDSVNKSTMYNKIQDFLGHNWRSYLTIQKIVYQFVIGFVSFMLGANLLTVLTFHLAWELFNNSTYGKNIAKTYLGKDLSDHFWGESLMDNILFVGGWVVGYYACGQAAISNPKNIIEELTKWMGVGVGDNLQPTPSQ